MQQTQVEKLDVVLSFLANLDEIQYPRVSVRLVQSNINTISIIHMEEILNRLSKDGFVDKNAAQGNPDLHIYNINFDGRILYESGGYQTKILREDNDAKLVQNELDRRRTLDGTLLTNASRLNSLTLWLAIGTGVLALIEIIKFLCEIDENIKAFFERLI